MIFCFSGTGNSRWIADTLSRNLNDRVIMINNDSIECDVAIGEPVLWVFPIYSWGVPPVVKAFIRRLQLNQSASTAHYMVCSCGDDIGLAHQQWRREMSKRGWQPSAAYSVIMPNTYTLMKGFDVDAPEVVALKLKNAVGRVADIVNKIKSGDKTDDVVKGSWAWVKTHIIYPYFVRYCMSPKPFRASNNCVSCGKCAKECPLKNIEMKDSLPQWHNECAMCLRCYQICPQHAVGYGNATKFKGQYIFPKVDK